MVGIQGEGEDLHIINEDDLDDDEIIFCQHVSPSDTFVRMRCLMGLLYT